MSSQQQSLLSLLSLHPQSINLERLLLTLCKPNSNPPEIDFLNLPQILQQINSFHQRTCQEIVEFVDAHCQQYLAMNEKFQHLQDNVDKVQRIVKEVGVKLTDYAKLYYSNQGKVQELITNYELSILQKVLLAHSQNSTQFLSQFVRAFQHIAAKPITQLCFRERHLLIKFCHDFNNFSVILNHHIVQQSIPQAGKIMEMIGNLVDEVQFYLSEQLQRVVGTEVKKEYKMSSDNLHKEHNQRMSNGQSGVNKVNPSPANISHHKGAKSSSLVIMKQLKLCYSYLNKLPQYYRLIEQHLISLQIQTAEKNLINQKINLIGGKSIEFVEQYFKAVFNVFNHLPTDYPKQRVLQLIFGQLRKTQVKFIYTYTLPIFPISYNSYIRQINALAGGPQLIEIRQILRKNHNWDLKRWVDVREKNIIDRCTKDWQKSLQTYYQLNNLSKPIIKQLQLQLQPTSNKQTSLLSGSQLSQQIEQKIPPPPDLIKWLQIIFKQNCKIEGVKNHIVGLAIKVVNKYSQVIQKSLDNMQLLPQFINSYVKTCSQMEEVISKKLMFFYDSADTNQNQQQLQQLTSKIANSCQMTIHKAIQKAILANTKLLSKSCCGSLQPYKQFIMKVIKPSKQFSQSHFVNVSDHLFKPLHSYLQNSLKFSSQSKEYINNIVVKQVMRYYDEIYVTEIYQYARVNLSVQQLAQVMAIVGNERTVLFVTNQAQQQSLTK